MILDRFEYLCPSNVDEAVSAITTDDELAIISGGTWVVPQMGHHVRRPKIVVDLRAAGLSGVADKQDTISIGSTTTYSHLMRSDPQQGHDWRVGLLRQSRIGRAGSDRHYERDHGSPIGKRAKRSSGNRVLR